MVIQPNHAGERVRALLSLGIATTAIIALSWTYALSGPQAEEATTGIRSDHPESSSGLIGRGLEISCLNTPDEDQPWTDTPPLQGVVEKGTPAYAECGPAGGVQLLGRW